MAGPDQHCMQLQYVLYERGGPPAAIMSTPDAHWVLLKTLSGKIMHVPVN
jgi:hypothetical protein